MALTALVALASLLVGVLVGVSWRRAQSHPRDATADQGGSGQPENDDVEERLRLAADAERNRIYNDLHDDLGARLLQLIYSAPTPEYADRARAALQDLRDVVSRSRGAPGDLHQVLAEIRREAQQRLSTVQAELQWEQADDIPEQGLPTERALHLYRIAREAISNALRHAQARRIRVRVRKSGDELLLDLTDDGQAGVPSAEQAGLGMRGMQSRGDELKGEIRWLPGTEGGTKVLLRVPLT